MIDEIRFILMLLWLLNFGLFFAYFIYYFFVIILEDECEFNKLIYIPLILSIIFFAISVKFNMDHPQPTYRQICESQGGIYIDNTGRAGDSCIYNGGKNE